MATLIWSGLGRSSAPSGTVMPVVICMTPWPQSNETQASPTASNGTPAGAIVRCDSSHAIARSSAAGTCRRPDAAARAPRTPASMSGRPK